MDIQKIQSGIDQIGHFQDSLRYENVALLTTGTSLNRWMIPTLQSVNDRLHLTALFGLEYGIMGERKEGEPYESYTDVWTGLPVFSLFRYGAVHLSREMLAKFDILIIDLPLTGTRFTSYISALHRLLRELGKTDKRVIILDRPNPLGGQIVEGPLLAKAVGTDEDDYALPIRYGLTLGELALLMNSESNLGAKLEVIQVKGWDRATQSKDSGLPWIMPQQHLPHYEACLLHAGLELFRGTNISLGIGTAMPYQVIGAPFLDAVQLSAILNKKSISGLLFHPTYFIPTIDRHQGELCQGVRIHITDSGKLQPLRFALELLYEIKQVAKQDFRFLQAPDGKYPIDRLFGNNRLRRQPEEYPMILEDAAKEAARFKELSQSYLLYS